MNFKTTGLLVALLIIVGTVWLFYPESERTANTDLPPSGPPDETKPIFDPKPDNDSIVRVTLERPGKQRLVFARSPLADQPEKMDKWQVLEPLAVPVQGYAVDGLVSTFSSLRSRSRMEEGLSAADAGFDPPTATLILTDKDGKEYKIEVGQKAAISNDTYIRVAGTDTIHIVTRDLLPQIKKDFNEYRDKRLCPLTPSAAVRVEIDVAGQAYCFTRGADEAWVIDEPIKAYAEVSELMNLVRKASSLRVEEFIEDAPEALTGYGLDQPYLTLRVTTETKRELPAEEDESTTQPVEPRYETVSETFALAVGGFADMQQEQRYTRLVDQQWVVSVNQKEVEGLVPDLVKLRDPRITRIKADQATRLELAADGQTVALEKVDQRWQGSGDLSELETEAVLDLLEAFEDLRAIDYILEPADFVEYGLDQPRATLTITAGGTVEPVTIHVGDLTRSARNAYVRRDGQTTVFVVSAAQAQRLCVTPLSLRSREIFNWDQNLFRQLEVVRDGTHYQLARDGRRWILSEPTEAQVESAAVRTLVGDLSRLRARRVVGKGDAARFGLDQPLVTMRFAVEEPLVGPTTQETTTAPATELVEHTLRISCRDTVAYCQLDDGPFIFELDDTVYRVFQAELIRRNLFGFLPTDVTGVTIITAGETLDFVRQGDQWKFSPDPFVKLDQEKLAGLVNDLAHLRVDSYVAYRDGDLGASGLLSAPLTISIRLVGGRLANLKIEQQRGDKPRLAGWVEEKCLFQLQESDCEKLFHGLDHYLVPETGEEQTAPSPRPAP